MTDMEDREDTRMSNAIITEPVIPPVVTAVKTVKIKRQNNNWQDPLIRLVTLRVISTLDLWKDISHGKKKKQNEKALIIWHRNLNAEQIDHHEVSRWQSVDNQALKWVRKYSQMETLQAKQTGHGDNSDDDDHDADHPALRELRCRFPDRDMKNEYVDLLNDLAACLSAKEAMVERQKNLKKKEKQRKRRLLSAGKFVQQQALINNQNSATSPASSSTSTPPPNGKRKRFMDMLIPIFDKMGEFSRQRSADQIKRQEDVLNVQRQLLSDHMKSQQQIQQQQQQQHVKLQMYQMTLQSLLSAKVDASTAIRQAQTGLFSDPVANAAAAASTTEAFVTPTTNDPVIVTALAPTRDTVPVIELDVPQKNTNAAIVKTHTWVYSGRNSSLHGPQTSQIKSVCEHDHFGPVRFERMCADGFMEVRIMDNLSQLEGRLTEVPKEEVYVGAGGKNILFHVPEWDDINHTAQADSEHQIRESATVPEPASKPTLAPVSAPDPEPKSAPAPSPVPSPESGPESFPIPPPERSPASSHTPDITPAPVSDTTTVPASKKRKKNNKSDGVAGKKKKCRRAGSRVYKMLASRRSTRITQNKTPERYKQK